jgi:hypothetical protein
MRGVNDLERASRLHRLDLRIRSRLPEPSTANRILITFSSPARARLPVSDPRLMRLLLLPLLTLGYILAGPILLCAQTAPASESFEYVTNPVVPQRADPWVYRHTDAWYYFTGSVPAYDRIELRRARTLQGLAFA